ncbi:MAG: helix-turn-helix domain-containing protein [Planctomycetes bacterium]|nr:helix-turn-helix domain-containing protein [Planctomycetota bacterium]
MAKEDSGIPIGTDALGQKRDWVSVREACEYLDVSEQTIFRWLKEGRLTYFKVGDSTRFKKEDLDVMVKKFTGDKDAEKYGAKCVSCGNSQLIPGQIAGTGKVYFKPLKTKFFVLAESVVNIEARTCPKCGFVQIFADTEKLNKLTKTKKEE